MAQGRSLFTLTVNAPEEQINSVIQDFLQANKFQYNEAGGRNYYTFHDPIMYGYRGFQYTINGNQVSIYAHVNKLGKEQDLSGFQDGAKTAYQNTLQTLFNALNSISGPVYNQVDPMTMAQQTNAPVYSQGGGGQFEAEAKKNYGKQAVIGFIVSIVALLAMIIAFAMGYFLFIGIPLIVATMILCINGTKSNRKGLAIAGIVVTGIDIITVLSLFILNLAFM